MTSDSERRPPARTSDRIEQARMMIGAPSPGGGTRASLTAWYASSLVRRVVLVLLGIVLGVSVDVAGLIEVPFAAYVVLGIWLALSGLVYALLRDRPPGTAIWRVNMVAHLGDIAGSLTLTHHLGATAWLAPLLLAMSIGHGGQMLPRLNTVTLAVVASLGYAVTMLAESRGIWEVHGPFAPAILPSPEAAVAAVLIVGFGILAFAAIQRGFFRQVAAIDERYARLLEAAREIIVTVDRRGRLLTVNAAFERILGWTREKAIGVEFMEFVEEADKLRAAEAFNDVLGGAIKQVDVHVRTAEGGTRLFSATAAPVRDEHGQITGALGISRDVTELRADAERLAANERQLRLLVRSMHETVFTVDRDLRFTSIYGRLAPDAPVAIRDVVGKSATDVLGGKLGGAFVEPMRRALIGERVEIEQEAQFGPDTRYFRTSFTPLKDDDESIVGVTGVAFDITEQRRAERERDVLSARLEESRRIEAIGRLISGVAHEINNPLAVILTFAEQLRAETHSAVDAAALEAIHAEAIRSRAIVRDLLAFVRPATQLPVTMVRPGPLFEGTLKSLRPHLASLGVELISEVGDDRTWINADVPGIEQVVTNLVLNGAQACGTGGRVHVRAASTNERFVLIVEDTGPGIPEHARPHLFEPFFTTKPAGEGTGLGLFVALGIVQRHLGTLRAENRLEGGARFTVELPRVATPEVAAEVIPAAVAAVPALPPRVLLIDDEDSIRLSLRRYFTRRGWEVADARDGAEGLKILQTEGPDAFAMVLCDLRMPGMSGAELHARVETELPQVLDRLVLVSGDVVSPDAAALVAATKCRLLEKPFELRALGALADEMVAEQRLAG